MWGTSNSWETCRSYAQAKSLYEATKPLRGNPNFRPLDRRSKHAKQSIRKVNEMYELVCYNTPVVTYYPDGSILLKSGGYHSQTTAAAIAASSPWSCWCKSGNGLIVQLSTEYNEAKRYCIGKELLVRPDGTPVDPQPAKVWKKRTLKDKAREVRAYFKEVAKRIDVYQTAFEGGTNPHKTALHLAAFKVRGLYVPMSEEEIDKLAWSHVPNDIDWSAPRPNGIAQRFIVDAGKKSIDAFWREVYAVFNVLETYSTELPLGKV